ncbi:MAG: hypothetical protein FJY97_12780 [candidate division Zixibacteria bacterium]|nr:hypothetical protein [candidate division Zixibacteria bacterium]
MNLELLQRPFPTSQIRKRKTSLGVTLEYLETPTVIARLNEAFDGEWSFRILDHKFLDDDVVVLGELTAEGVAKQQFGTCELSQETEDGMVLSMGDALKAAASDALKKAATLFGVGLHLYGVAVPDKPSDAVGAPVPVPVAEPPTVEPDKPNEPSEPPSEPDEPSYTAREEETGVVSESDIDALLNNVTPPESLITDLQLAEILDLARNRKFSKDQVEQRARSRYGRSLKDLSQTEAGEILEKLKGR